jgi:hypothetical protein
MRVQPYISVQCDVPKAQQDKTWPTTLATIPRTGELVQAKEGKVLQIETVTHSNSDGLPMVLLKCKAVE